MWNGDAWREAHNMEGVGGIGSKLAPFIIFADG